MDDLISHDKSRLSSFQGFMPMVYGWMTLGLFITAVVSFIVMILAESSESLFNLFLVILPIVFIVELIVVVVLSTMWRKFNAFISLGLFLFYAILNGLFFGVIILNYELGSVAIAFLATVLTFGVMAAYGTFTKQDLTKIGNVALMGLFGLIIGSIINIIIFVINPTLGDGLYWILTYVGLGIFVVLVAVDAQKLKRLQQEAESTNGSLFTYSIQGALILYLDFINIFIRVLRIMGKRR